MGSLIQKRGRAKALIAVQARFSCGIAETPEIYGK